MIDIGGWLRAHRTPVLAGGAAAAGGLFLWQRRKAAPGVSASGDAATAGSLYTPGSAGSSGYDSTGSDLYNNLEPMIEGPYNGLDQLGQSVSGDVQSLDADVGSQLDQVNTNLTGIQAGLAEAGGKLYPGGRPGGPPHRPGKAPRAKLPTNHTHKDNHPGKHTPKTAAPKQPAKKPARTSTRSKLVNPRKPAPPRARTAKKTSGRRGRRG
jgi:hypothetical protein